MRPLRHALVPHTSAMFDSRHRSSPAMRRTGSARAMHLIATATVVLGATASAQQPAAPVPPPDIFLASHNGGNRLLINEKGKFREAESERATFAWPDSGGGRIPARPLTVP